MILLDGYSVSYLFNSLSEGDYNQIRLDRALFYQVLERHKKTREAREELRKRHLNNMKNGGGGGGRKRGAFRSNSKDLNQEERWVDVDSLEDVQKAKVQMTKEVRNLS